MVQPFDYSIRSTAQGPLQALLRANNIPFALTEGDRVLVAPEQSGGLMIEFMPQT